ncbi:RagB/SusD family nutrient uptake outer membrane protein [Chitinophaga lutea]
MQQFKIYAAALLLTVATGCKKFLEQPPDNRAQLTSPEQVSRLLGTAYPQANYMQFTEIASDNALDKGVGNQGNALVDPYKYVDVRDDEQDSPEYYWNSCYKAIAAANQALEACMKASNPAAYTAQKGEALVARAYSHFMLVTLFSETYDPATAASKPGVPYVTEPEKQVVKQYDRKTVAYVYEMIEKDLLEGMPLINEKSYTVPRYHFNKAAANAFACRFYLYKRDYAKAVEYANQVFADGNVAGKLRPWNTRYKELTVQEMFSTYAKATEEANLLLCETVSFWGREFELSRYGMNSVMRDRIFGSNVTLGEWAFENHIYYRGLQNYLMPKINEYFVRTSVNAEIGLGYIMVPLFTTEEVLFNRAEAYAYLNNTTAAIADLNTYASTRINNYDPVDNLISTTRIRQYYGITDARTGIIRTILDFKRAEYAQEGMRWFDILRYRIPVTHMTTDGEVITLTGDDPRRLFQIPPSAGESGVPQNPR